MIDAIKIGVKYYDLYTIDLNLDVIDIEKENNKVEISKMR